VILPAGVTGSVTAATPTQLTVTGVTGLVAGALNVQASVSGYVSSAAAAGTVKPIVTQAATLIKPNAMTLTINGYGFSTTAASNVFAFTPGVTGFVSTSTKTQLTYVFTTPPQNGILIASATTNGVGSGAAVQVAIVDGVAPTATGGKINLDGASLGKVSVDLSEDVVPALLLSHFKVDGVGAPAVQILPTGVVQDPASHRATFSFAAPFGVRNYKGTLTAQGLTDAAGNPMAVDYKFNFFYLPGDANGDKSVGPGDFNLLASSFGKTGQTWATGDFNGDGAVGPGDFNLLASNFGVTLPNPPAPIVAEPPAARATAKRFVPLRDPVLPLTVEPAGSIAKSKAKHGIGSQLLKGVDGGND
jgi:hypothetical protein